MPIYPNNSRKFFLELFPYRIIQRFSDCKRKRIQRALYSSSRWPHRVDRNFFRATQIGTLHPASRFRKSLSEKVKRDVCRRMRRAGSQRDCKTRQRTVIPAKDKPSYLPWPMYAAGILFAIPPDPLCALLLYAHRTPWSGLYTYIARHCEQPLCASPRMHIDVSLSSCTWLFCKLEGLPD